MRSLNTLQVLKQETWEALESRGHRDEAGSLTPGQSDDEDPLRHGLESGVPEGDRTCSPHQDTKGKRHKTEGVPHPHTGPHERVHQMMRCGPRSPTKEGVLMEQQPSAHRGEFGAAGVGDLGRAWPSGGEESTGSHQSAATRGCRGQRHDTSVTIVTVARVSLLSV